ncbi:von Willebrand factor A domain-containing protein 5A-like [Oryctolagus cuniculus]|uniref:von Willebrand factor A domain-containing protein 5A-like n=1 Tax=Oryctolagus cuniculus TaxID=9986 RepID=UPI0038795503
MGDPCAMVSFYPDIPESEPSVTCGEFVFLMDCSGSMKCPMSKQAKSQLCIEAAKGKLIPFFFWETLLLLLKSLSIGCYFKIYEFGSLFEAFLFAFLRDSVKHTQQTMEEAVRRVQLMNADPGGTETLTPLQDIDRRTPIAGHPYRFVFTDGEVTDTCSVIKEVKFNSRKHRYEEKCGFCWMVMSLMSACN